MSPVTAKLVAAALAIVASVVGAHFKGTELAMATVVGWLIGKEFAGRTGDAPAITHPDDLPIEKK